MGYKEQIRVSSLNPDRDKAEAEREAWDPQVSRAKDPGTLRKN